MIYSKGSVGMRHQGAHDGLAGGVVVPDRGGEGEDSPQDSDGDAVDGVTAVLLKAELALEGVVDGLGDLPQGLEELRAGARGRTRPGEVDDPHVVGPLAGAGGQDAGVVPDQAAGGAEPLVAAGRPVRGDLRGLFRRSPVLT